MLLSALLLLSSVGAVLPEGAAPPALTHDHFPSRLHAFVWRNWTLVPLAQMAATVEADPEALAAVGHSMGLSGPAPIPVAQFKRSYITIIRANWHLLPYPQLLTLLGWTADELAFTLREDDFLYVKLGNLKPKCDPLQFAPPTEAQAARAAEIAALMRARFPQGPDHLVEPLFSFIGALSRAPEGEAPPALAAPAFSPRFCYSYFALYGDPLLGSLDDLYPDGYLERLRRVGADGVWLQGVLYKLAPFPWDPTQSQGHEQRLEKLRALIARAKSHGMRVYLYLNEPRAMPQAFYDTHPDLKGVSEGEFAALCTGAPQVRDYLAASVAHICREVPELAGFFTITGSENLSNCWSHYQGANCVRCAPIGPAETIAAVNRAIQEGIDQAGGAHRLIAWDWGWLDAWAPQAIAALPEKVALMSVSEWSMPLNRGGIASEIGEYALSAVGPGPRAARHWGIARERGLDVLAKTQLGTTWELGSVPYIPAVANAARHAHNLRSAGVSGLMLGWTLGGYPSPNLEAVAAYAGEEIPEVAEALRRVATARYGQALAETAVQAWTDMSAAFEEFPLNPATLYNGPQHIGPANLLYPKATGFAASMVGIPYDDLTGWRGPFPPEIFAAQLDKVAEGFGAGALVLRQAAQANSTASPAQRQAMLAESALAHACALHYASSAAQTRFIHTRNQHATETDPATQATQKAQLIDLAQAEAARAVALHGLQIQDSRLGFEASNHYFFVPLDLAEKVINATWIADTLAR